MANVKCPHCGFQIDIDEALQRDIKAKFEDEILQQKRKWQQQQNEATFKLKPRSPLSARSTRSIWRSCKRRKTPSSSA